MAWSIFTQGGGKGAAQTWATDLLSQLGAPQTPANVQVVYDWEVSEGGGGKYNPLNQGPVPGHPELTTTGSQYGGGAADYASWNAGLQGAVDYLNMSNFASIKKALMAGDSAGARSAIIASPWAASHYGSGSAFSNEPLPGQATALPGYTPGPSSTSSVVPASVAGSFLNGLAGALGAPNVKDLAQRASLILLGAVLVVVGLLRFTGSDKKIIKAGGTAAKESITKGAAE